MTAQSKAATHTRTEVWAQLFLQQASRDALAAFLVSQGVSERRIVMSMHLTVYHARRPLPGIVATAESAQLAVAAEDLRFMVMAPGGENPRPELEPSRLKVGIRIRRQSEAYARILAYRERFIAHETKSVLGRRRPSTARTSAFGARSFQPHVALLRAKNGVDRDLSVLGRALRVALAHTPLTFDRFIVDVTRKQV